MTTSFTTESHGRTQRSLFFLWYSVGIRGEAFRHEGEM